jgi:hypothetical protein
LFFIGGLMAGLFPWAPWPQQSKFIFSSH